MSVGKRIKERRNELHMSVDELATKLNKNRAIIYRYEKGDIEKIFAVSERSVKHVAMWHVAFGMDAFTDEEFEKLLGYGKLLMTLRK